MKRLIFKKRGIVWETLVWGIVVSLLAIVMIKVASYNKDLVDTDVINQYNIDVDSDFVPHDYDAFLSEEEKIVRDSVNSLIISLNSLAKRAPLNSYSEAKITKTKVKDLRVSYLSELDVENYGGIFGRNIYPNWVFTKKFNVAIGQPKISEYWIYSDYSSNWCGNNKGSFSCNTPLYENGYIINYETGQTPTRCVCDGQPSIAYNNEFQILPSDVQKQAKANNMPMIRDLQSVKQLVLEVEYSDGTPSCLVKANTNSDFWAWGEMEDRDGDGIKGSYSKGNQIDSDVGKNVESIMSTEQLSLLSTSQKQAYFSNGKVSVNSGEGCLDSPTFAQCPGVRVYYCGKKGGAPQGSPQTERYFRFGSDGNVHSVAGAKFLTVVDDGFTDEKESINPENSDRILTSQGIFKIGDIDFAKSFNYGGPLNYHVINKLLSTEQKDPKTLCYGGNEKGETLSKCDENECNICNFNLPQNITKDYNSAQTFIAGAGDPKYLVYYEAFPDGEDEPWTMDVENVVLWSLVMQDILYAAVPKVAQLGKKLIGATTRVMGKIPGLRLGVKAIRAGGRVVSKAKQTAQNTGFNLLKSASKRGNAAFNKLFKNPEDVYKKAKSIDVFDEKKMLDVADELVIMDNAQSFEYLQEIYDNTQASPVAKSALSKFIDSLPPDIRTKVVNRGNKYAIALVVALYAVQIDAENQKFQPVGIDQLALKVHQADPLYSGGGVDSLNYNIDGYYGYYLQLVKDKNKGIVTSLFDQNGQRFYLASPCVADLKLYRTNCQCRTPNPSEGFVFLNQDTGELSEKPVTDGNWISVVKETVDIQSKDARAAIKFCQAEEDYTNYNINKASGNVYTPSCILIDPTIKEGSFCYGGSHAVSEILSYSVLTANVAASFALTAGAIIPNPSLPVLIGTQIIIDIASAYVDNYIQKTQKWPNH